MSKRRTIALRSLVPASNKPLETRDCTDGEKRTYERFLGPAQAAQVALTTAINNDEVLVIEGMMQAAKLEASKGWKFNREKMRWERYHVPKEE
jgi:hypothetical protein